MKPVLNVAKIIIAAMLLWAPLTFAGDFWFGPGAVSLHTDRGTKHNEFNLGFNVEYAWSDAAVGAGVYRNSDWRETHYAAYRYTPWTLGDFKLGGLMGLADGYSAGVSPLGALTAVYEHKHWGLNLMATPYAGGAVLALQFKVKL